MVKIDFVPNDYTQQRQSGRANFMYLMLFLILMVAIGSAFTIIKVREKAVKSSLEIVDKKMVKAQEQITQLEDLQVKSKKMMATMSMAAELLDPVPKSVILACLTNNMPSGLSLLEVKVLAKEAQGASKAASSSQYQAASGAAASPTIPKAKLIETNIEIKGIAPSDIEVASFIARLGGSVLLTNVALVESKEHKIERTKFREFKITSKVRPDIRLTKEDLESLRAKIDDTI
ncbi:MAG: PilN domain-containing protein [Planctomycetota bacterium]|jgi:Tfp pilus assembly protein PilN